jgi:RNA polymerase sigma-70 factor (ECF subfamily)
MTARARRKGQLVGGNGERAEEFEESRGHLRAVAMRIVGSTGDPSAADDAVQETWLRFQRTDTADVVNLRGWLTTVVSRICLDMLRSRRAHPETPTGHHPIPVEGERRTENPPEDETVLGDSVGRALLLVLDTLSPAERVAFVLHDVFAVPFADIAEVLSRSPEAAKKLAARARRRVQIGREPSTADIEPHRRLVEAFLAAIRSGNTGVVVSLLAPDVVRRVDRALLPPGSPEVVRGAAAVAEEARTFSKPAWAARPALINGSVGAVVSDAEQLILAIVFGFHAGTIAQFRVIGDPTSLAALKIDSL